MQTGSRISRGKIRFSPIFLLENRSVIIHGFPRARTPIHCHERYTGLDGCDTHGCWFVTLDPEYPRLSPLTGSRTSGPAIFAIYLLLVIGLTGESQAEHKRMLFMDAWKKRRERARPFYVGNPCSIETKTIFQFARSIAKISFPSFKNTVQVIITSCVLFEFFILLQLLRYVVCEEEIEEGGDFRGIVFRRGRISFIGFDIGWFSFFHGGELGKKAV